MGEGLDKLQLSTEDRLVDEGLNKLQLPARIGLSDEVREASFVSRGIRVRVCETVKGPEFGTEDISCRVKDWASVIRQLKDQVIR